VGAVRTSIEIAASPEEVWKVIMDPHRLDDWVTIHRKLGAVSDDPLRDGSSMEQTLCVHGVHFKVKWQVVELEAPRLAVMAGRGPAHSSASIRDELTAVNGGTRFDYTNEFKAPMGPLGSAATRLLVGGASEREANASLRKLKDLVERH
jgi:uncharacterized protein YndB with AHSA1/START domain